MRRVFVSWFLGQALDEVLDALDVFLEQSGLDRDRTYFWVCDYSFDLNAIAKGDPTAELPARVKAIGHTVLLLDPWHAPAPLKRIWCGPAARTLPAQRLPRPCVGSHASAPRRARSQVHLGGLHDADGRRALRGGDEPRADGRV